MWFDGQRQPDTIYVASVSRGKDSTAMLRAIQLLGWPLDMVYSVDIWFDDETPAELPPMVQFKDHWDARCKEVFGIDVTRGCATATPEQKTDHPFVSIKRQKEKHTATASSIIIQNQNTAKISMDGRSLSRHGVNSLNQPTQAPEGNLKRTYCDYFFRNISGVSYRTRAANKGFLLADKDPALNGFPCMRRNWCQGELKRAAVQKT